MKVWSTVKIGMEVPVDNNDNTKKNSNSDLITEYVSHRLARRSSIVPGSIEGGDVSKEIIQMAARVGWNLQLAKYFSFWRHSKQHQSEYYEMDPREYYEYRLASSVMTVWMYNSNKIRSIGLCRRLRLMQSVLAAWRIQKCQRLVLREIAKHGSVQKARDLSNERLCKTAFSYWKGLAESSALLHVVFSNWMDLSHNKTRALEVLCKFHRHRKAQRKDKLTKCFKCWNVQTNEASEARTNKLRALLSLYSNRSEQLQSELRPRDGTRHKSYGRVLDEDQEQRAIQQIGPLLLSNQNTI